MGLGCVSERTGFCSSLNIEREEYRTKPRFLVQATEERAKLGNIRGRAGAGRVSCEVGHLGGGAQETGVEQGRAVRAEREK